MRLLAFILFVLGLLVTGVLGTETRLLFFWPGCLILGLAGLVAGARWKMRIHFAPSDACLASVLVLMVYLAGRAWMSPVEIYAREDLFIVLAGFVTYVLTCTVASHPRWRMAIMWALVLLTIGNLIVGFIHFSNHWSFHLVPGFVRTFGEGGQRIGGFFINSNHLAAFLSFVVFLTLGLLCFGRGGASMKLMLGFLCLSASIGISLTASRGALLGMVGGAAVFGLVSLGVIWKTQRHIFGRLLSAVLVVCALAGSVLWIVTGEVQKRRMPANPLGDDVRLHVWPSALAQNAMQPATGMGSRMFYDYSVTLRDAGMPSYHVDPLFAHNEYLQMLADYGWVGLALVVLVIGLHVTHGLRFVRWFTEHKFVHTASLMSNTLGFAIGGLGALAATLGHAMFEFHFHVAAVAITGSLVMGLLANPGFDLESTKHWRLSGVRPLAKLALTLASVVMIGGAVWYGPADWWLAQVPMARATKDMQQRLTVLDQAIARDAHNPESWYQRGLARMDQWRPDLPKTVSTRLLESAAADLDQAVKLNPQHYLYATALVDVYDRLGREADALRLANFAIKAAPWHEESRLSLAIHHHRWMHFREAEQCYLWCRSARLRNREGELTWLDGYRQLLSDAMKVTGGKQQPLE
jgi:hypothetical protein